MSYRYLTSNMESLGCDPKAMKFPKRGRYNHGEWVSERKGAKRRIHLKFRFSKVVNRNIFNIFLYIYYSRCAAYASVYISMRQWNLFYPCKRQQSILIKCTRHLAQESSVPLSKRIWSCYSRAQKSNDNNKNIQNRLITEYRWCKAWSRSSPHHSFGSKAG